MNALLSRSSWLSDATFNCASRMSMGTVICQSCQWYDDQRSYALDMCELVTLGQLHLGSSPPALREVEVRIYDFGVEIR